MILATIPDVPNEFRSELKKKHGDIYFSKNFSRDKDRIPCEDIEVLVTYGFDINCEMLEQLPSLRWVQVFQTGVHHIPFAELEKRNIMMTNLRGIYGTPISEYIMAYILYFVRDINRYLVNQKNKDYNREIAPDEVSGKTIVILGAGTIGKEIAKKAKFFGMNVIGVNTSGKLVDNFDQMYTIDHLNHVVAMGDFIVALFPVTEKTHHCITKEHFSLMKESAYFINIGRAALVVEEDLIESLQKKVIKGAVLDVFNKEPLPKESPLWGIENLYITPHISGKSRMFFRRGFEIFNENYMSFVRKQPLKFTFDFKKGY